jgi:hypothetical protein
MAAYPRRRRIADSWILVERYQQGLAIGSEFESASLAVPDLIEHARILLTGNAPG